MKNAGLAFAFAAFVTGLIAAWYWWKASAVEVKANVALAPKGGMATADGPFLGGAIDAIQRSSALNKRAALWTAASVICGGVASVLGALAA